MAAGTQQENSTLPSARAIPEGDRYWMSGRGGIARRRGCHLRAQTRAHPATAVISKTTVGPLATHELSVPAKDGLRPDHERSPSVPGEPPARRGEERPIPVAKLRPADRTSGHLHLVAEDRVLELEPPRGGAAEPGTLPGNPSRGARGRSCNHRDDGQATRCARWSHSRVRMGGMKGAGVCEPFTPTRSQRC
jgi:hypothetical protein